MKKRILLGLIFATLLSGHDVLADGASIAEGTEITAPPVDAPTIAEEIAKNDQEPDALVEMFDKAPDVPFDPNAMVTENGAPAVSPEEAPPPSTPPAP